MGPRHLQANASLAQAHLLMLAVRANEVISPCCGPALGLGRGTANVAFETKVLHSRLSV